LAEFLYTSSPFAFVFSHVSTCVGFLYGFSGFVLSWAGFSLGFSQHTPFLSVFIPTQKALRNPFPRHTLFHALPFTPFLLRRALSFFYSRFRLPPSPHLLFPSPYAFQLRIRVRFTQLTFLSLLEPLDFRPFGFSPSFPLLMSTFSLLITSASSLRLLFRSTERSTTFQACSQRAFSLLPSTWNNRFGHNLSLFYLRCKRSHLVRCYSFIIRWLLPSLLPSCLRPLTSFFTSFVFETLSFCLGCLPLN